VIATIDDDVRDMYEGLDDSQFLKRLQAQISIRDFCDDCKGKVLSARLLPSRRTTDSAAESDDAL